MKIGGLWSLRSTGMIRIPGRLGPSGAESIIEKHRWATAPGVNKYAEHLDVYIFKSI